MPYKLQKVPKKDLYWVVNKETGKKHSKEGLPKERAEAQRRALYAAESGYTMRGSGISMDLMQQMAQSAYRGKTKLQIGPFKLLTSTPTLKFYTDGSTIVIAVRGTELTDKIDLAADALAIIGKLRSSERWKKDKAKIEEVQEKFPRSQYNYVAVGHSLGGALIDLMLRDKLVRTALSYNPLVEPQELGGNNLHRRIYHKDDPLYQTFGRFIPNVEVRTTAEPFWKYYLQHNLPFGLGDLFTLYDRHRIARFKGGMKGGMTFNDFRRWWFTPLNQRDREILQITGDYGSARWTRGDIALIALSSIAGIGGVSYDVSDDPVRGEPHEGSQGSNAVPFWKIFGAIAVSPIAGYLLSRLTRLFPMPPTRQQEQQVGEQERDIAINVNPLSETQRAAVRIDQAQRAAEQLNLARTFGVRNPLRSTVAAALPRQAEIGGVPIEMAPEARAAAAAEALAETEPAALRRTATRREFPQVMPSEAAAAGVGDLGGRPNFPIDRNADGKQDEEAFVEGSGREIVFEDQLKELDYPPKKYLSKARSKAKKAGYESKKLKFCRDGIHKLQIETPEGEMVKFGRVGYGDFLIWSFLERNGKAEKGEARKRRKLYLKRASKIEGDWEDNKFSPNNLAMKILW